ncbi:MAG: hypothetical protein LKJ69_06700 [Lactobacillus sp.]|jgi:multisubunit Na+/H+ antiporter MnhB subunit|nr:hypothetical protein [Lactobacillus sp.]MCI2033078.1 hypothetical protein [Lactobacillus sp.]
MQLWLYFADLFMDTSHPFIALMVVLLIEAVTYVLFLLAVIKQRVNDKVRILFFTLCVAVCLYGTGLCVLGIEGPVVDKYGAHSLQFELAMFGPFFLSGITALTSVIATHYVLFHWRLEPRFIHDQERLYLSRNKSWGIGVLGALQISLSGSMFAFFSLSLIGSENTEWWQILIAEIVGVSVFVAGSKVIFINRMSRAVLKCRFMAV